MKATSEKTQSWNEVIKECFNVFDRSESGLISKKDFEFVLVNDTNGPLFWYIFSVNLVTSRMAG